MDSRYLNKVKRRDRWARWVIVAGGFGIIASMMVMIVFMVKVTLPLFHEPSRELLRRIDINDLDDPIIFDVDPYLENGLSIDASGRLSIFELSDSGNLVSTQQIDPPASSQPEQDEEGVPVSPTTLLRAEKYGKHFYVLYWSHGGITQIRNEFKPVFDEQNQRQIISHVEVMADFAPFVDAATNAPSCLRIDEDGSATIVRRLDPNEVFLYRVAKTEDFFGETSEETFQHRFQIPGGNPIVAMALTQEGRWLYLGTRAGTLLIYDLEDIERPDLVDTVQATSEGALITTMAFPFGESSIAVGDEKGEITAWSLIRFEDGPQLKKIHTFSAHNFGVTTIRSSFRDKTFVSRDQTGQITLTHLTSERRLMVIDPEFEILDFALSERLDGLLLLDTKKVLWLWGLHIPHPEISWSTLWHQVWYEGYPMPEYAWQSSSAMDDFEPKMSLVPLLFGSLKGTFYGMLFSLPLALLCAMYVSHLMEPKWRVLIKPVVELMAAVPTVVIGFLAALWLAPKLEANLLAVVFSLVIIPLFILVAMWIFMQRKRKIGAEFFLVVPFVVVGFLLAYKTGLWIQATSFGGNINLWLFQHLGLSIDQRNCVVISFALGFAVIPIIFTISEDALHNVPKHLTAAAMALGSSRWQTLRRVVLPMASPGIFAATMIGFGRAVGETMIVLMATGNTPIMSPSILNGMRTLAANIAVEIPEAPVGSSLYRLLFLSALLLFGLTFIINTVAELVRHQLQKKYKNL